MPIRIKDLSGMEVFLDTIRLGSITAAAQEHGIAQPSATEKIRQLERRLGFRLLRRGPGGSIPTVQGEAVAGWGREVVRAVDRLATGVEALRDRGADDPLRIMASLTVAEYVLPACLHLHRRAGGQPVELAVANSAVVARAVLDGKVEMGFIESPWRFPGLSDLVVGGDRLVVVVAPGHPWAQRRRKLRPVDLAKTPLLVREVGSGTRDAFETALANAGFDMAPPLAVMGSTTALKAAAMAGDGPCVLSELAVADEIALGRLVEVPVDELEMDREFRAVWPVSGATPPVQQFVRLVKRAIES
jgi:molybdate transport repressor ModE-like protein